MLLADGSWIELKGNREEEEPNFPRVNLFFNDCFWNFFFGVL
jgi:hypothetical protein